MSFKIIDRKDRFWTYRQLLKGKVVGSELQATCGRSPFPSDCSQAVPGLPASAIPGVRHRRGVTAVATPSIPSRDVVVAAQLGGGEWRADGRDDASGGAGIRSGNVPCPDGCDRGSRADFRQYG